MKAKPKANTGRIVTDPFGTSAVYVLAITVVVAGLVYWMAFQAFVRAPKLIVIQIGTASACLLWAISALRKPAFAAPPQYFRLLAAFVVWAFCSALWAADTPLAIDTAVHWAVCVFALWVVGELLVTPGRLAIVLWSLTIVTGAIAAIGVFQSWGVLTVIPQTTAPGATFGNRNMASEAVVFLIPATLLHFALQEKRSGMVIVGCVLSFAFAYLAFARSIASWLAASAELIVFLSLWYVFRGSLSRLITREKLLIAAASLMLCIMIVASNRTEGAGIESIIRAKVIDRSKILTSNALASGLTGVSRVEPRPVLYANTLHMIGERPWLGVGLANFGGYFPGSRLAENEQPGKYFDVTYWEYANTHNDWLQITSELGLVGAALLIGALAFWFKAVVEKIRSSDAPENKVVAFTPLVLVVGAALNSSFSFPFYCPYPPFILAIIFGAAAAIRSKSGPIGNEGRVRRNLVWPLGVFAVVTPFIVWRSTLRIEKETHVGLMLDAAKVGDHRRVIESGERSLSAHFSSQLAVTYLGRAYDELGEPTKALYFAERHVENQPFSPSGVFFKAHCLWRTGRKEEAIGQVNLAAAMGKSTPRVQLNCAILLEKCGEIDGSLALLRELRDKDGKYNLELAMAALRAGKNEIARQALVLAKDFDQDATRLAMIRQLLGKFESPQLSPP